jgi:hypothetical protein
MEKKAIICLSFIAIILIYIIGFYGPEESTGMKNTYASETNEVYYQELSE